MLYWVFQITIISIVLIFLVHHLINFFKSTLTVPKIKDLVNSPTKKYEQIYNTISINNNSSENKFDYDVLDLLPKPDIDSMKSELKNFLKKQLNPNNDNDNIKDLVSYNYSPYGNNMNPYESI
jgi:hypothetical protein